MKDKVIFVAGGFGLIGKCVSLDLIKAGYKVIIGDFESKENLTWLSSIPKEKVLFCETDVLNSFLSFHM